MKSNKLFILLLLLAAISGCGGGGGGGSTTKTLVSIAVTPANPTIALGTTQQFNATGTFSDSSTQDLTTSVTWTSSNTGVATIVADGLATAIAVGSTTITAASGGVSGATSLTVTSATLVSIAVTPANPSIALGATQQFTATGTFSNGTTQNLTTSVTWTSSSTGVATIATNGLATAIAAGSTTITAASGGVSGATSLTVTSATLVSIAVTPANPSIALGATQQFTATGTFSNGTTQNLTTSVTWTSSSTGVATIAANGLASAAAAGSTTIMASSGSISGTTTMTVTGGGSSQANVMSITVNGSLCLAANSSGYFNKPCVSVTICTPGTSTCQVVTDILLDTGSYGLRIFSTSLTGVSLTQVASPGGGSLAECAQFGDGSSLWGPVMTAGVVLGGETAVQVPIQVVNASFGTPPTACRGADASPTSAGFNGILGVGLFAQDCGTNCSNSANNGMYYSVSGTTVATTAPLSSQVINPVAALPVDKNGVLVQLPNVPLGGVSSINGSLVLGIGTQSNNTPSSVTMYPASQSAEFTTLFNGVSSSTSFIDSGSNGLYFSAPTSLLPRCTGANSSFYCPGTTQSLTATNTGATGSPSGAVPFQIGNFTSLINTSNNVFIEIGGTNTGGFDWGLPFFFGRNVFVGISGTSSSLGSGPYWAY